MEGPPSRLDQVERMLEDHGRQIGPVRVAAGRSGVAVGFPRDPLLHVSWLSMAVAAVLAFAARILRRR